MRILTIIFVIVVIGAMIGLSFLSRFAKTTTNQNPSTPSTTQTKTEVVINNNAFEPSQLVVKPGTTVTFTNKDADAHTVVADNNSFQSPTLQNGQSWSYTFNTSGNYPYYCSIHPEMKAVIAVQ